MSSPPRSRLAPDDLLVAGARALGIRLEAEEVKAFSAYREEVVRWSARTNLTALREPAEIVHEGFLDSLVCLPLIPAQASRVLDVGSGAGFPALPLKLIRSDLCFTLVEASRKKASFLRHMVRSLRLRDVRVLNLRAESLAQEPSELGAYDLALARAVAPLPDQAGLVRPFLRSGGLFLAQVGPGPSVSQALDVVLGLGFSLEREVPAPSSLGRTGRRVLVLRRPEARPG